MNKAAELLTGSKISVADAAAVFKKQFGVSPLEYRRKSSLE